MVTYRARVRRLIVLGLVLSLLAPAAAAAGAPALLAGPCTPGAVYNPACDADQDGDVDIFDIQLAAGHWNQIGTFVSDNNHNHLGQTWTGGNNPVRIQGSFTTSGSSAPLILNNSGSGGDGLRVDTVNDDGIYLNSIGGNGLYINSADEHGLYVSSAGLDGVVVNSADRWGVYVGSAADDGLAVVNAGRDGVLVSQPDRVGVRVLSAGSPSSTVQNLNPNGFEVAGAEGYGLYVGRADIDGVAVDSAALDGFDVNSAGDNGVEAGGANYAGYFTNRIYVNGNCIGCLLTAFAVNADSAVLEPGDVVAPAGMQSATFDNGSALLRVRKAAPGDAVVGVVATRAEVYMDDEPQPDETGERLVPREGAAQPGDYVAVVYSGPMQVRVAPNEAAISAGVRVTAASDGTVRPL
ncbi:MAG: hypothetical protein H6649_14245, partial [Caldilineae bacterium]|nr:hypothetical protein [Caldilineae bacterium]